eukprot:sb/3462439/
MESVRKLRRLSIQYDNANKDLSSRQKIHQQFMAGITDPQAGRGPGITDPQAGRGPGITDPQAGRGPGITDSQAGRGEEGLNDPSHDTGGASKGMFQKEMSPDREDTLLAAIRSTTGEIRTTPEREIPLATQEEAELSPSTPPLRATERDRKHTIVEDSEISRLMTTLHTTERLDNLQEEEQEPDDPLMSTMARPEIINRSTQLTTTLQSKLGNLPSVGSCGNSEQLGTTATTHRETRIGQSGTLGTNHSGSVVSGGSKYAMSRGLVSNLEYNHAQHSNSSGRLSNQYTQHFSSEMERGKREMELKLAQYRIPPLTPSRPTSGTSWASSLSSGALTSSQPPTAQPARTFGFGSQQQQSSFQSRWHDSVDETTRRKVEILDRIYGREERMRRFPHAERPSLPEVWEAGDGSKIPRVGHSLLGVFDQEECSTFCHPLWDLTSMTVNEIKNLERDILTPLTIEDHPPPMVAEGAAQPCYTTQLSPITAQKELPLEEEVEKTEEVTAVTPTGPEPGPVQSGPVDRRDWATGPGGNKNDTADKGDETGKKKKQKKKKKDDKKEEQKRLSRERSRKSIGSQMKSAWNKDPEDAMKIRGNNKAGIYDRLRKMKTLMDLEDDAVHFKEIVDEGVQMFKFFFSQVVAFVKGIKIAGKKPKVLHDAYEGVAFHRAGRGGTGSNKTKLHPSAEHLQVTELVALINLAELATQMDIEEEDLVTAMDDFDHALRDFDKLLRSIIAGLVK